MAKSIYSETHKKLLTLITDHVHAEPSTLRRIDALTAQLDELSEALNVKINALNETLDKLHPAVTVWLEPPLSSGWVLGYAKVKTWVVAAKNEIGEVYVLTNAPRVVRVEAMKKLNDLLCAIEQRLRWMIEQSKKAIP